jgi:hypothetical protein
VQLPIWLKIGKYPLRVRIVVSILLLLSFALAGCASKTKSREQIQHAYAAGVEAGRMQAQQQAQSGVPQVRFVGHVNNPIVLWTEDLTLAKALVDAEYLDQNTPRTITIYRNGQPNRVDPQTLLDGQDYPLFPGDTVVIQN